MSEYHNTTSQLTKILILTFQVQNICNALQARQFVQIVLENELVVVEDDINLVQNQESHVIVRVSYKHFLRQNSGKVDVESV